MLDVPQCLLSWWTSCNFVQVGHIYVDYLNAASLGSTKQSEKYQQQSSCQYARLNPLNWSGCSKIPSSSSSLWKRGLAWAKLQHHEQKLQNCRICCRSDITLLQTRSRLCSSFCTDSTNNFCIGISPYTKLPVSTTVPVSKLRWAGAEYASTSIPCL